MDLKKIVVATDFSDASLTAVETAFSLTLESGATLYLLHVLEPVAPIDPMAMVDLAFEELYADDVEQKIYGSNQSYRGTSLGPPVT